MRCVEVESVDPSETGTGLERRRLAAELDVANLATNHYTVPAGERLAGLHAHADRPVERRLKCGAATPAR